MAMNVLFVYSLDNIQSPEKPLCSQEQICFGISYISAVLKKYGHSTRLVVLSKVLAGRNRKTVEACLKQFHPQLICFTAVATEYQFMAEIAKYVKGRHPDVYLLIGGPHASLNPTRVLRDDFDALCVGEGEYPVLELLTQLGKGIRPSGIPNLWIKHASEVERNSPRPFMQDLDGLPFPDREMWQEWIEERLGSRISVLLGRGCPFQCAYCCNHAFMRLAPGPYVRLRSPDNIVEEVKAVAARFPTIKKFHLEVETIGLNTKWALVLISKLQRLNETLSEPLAFGANLRVTPNRDEESLFAAFQKCNFKYVDIGLESGSERVRREILRRNYSNEDVIRAVRMARKYGLKVGLYNMIGIPGETIDDFRETVKINRLCAPDYHYTSVFFPYPGTDLYSLCREQGILNKPLETDMERVRAVLDLPGFRKCMIQKSQIWFDYYVFKGRKSLYKILIGAIALEFLWRSGLMYFYRRLVWRSFFRWLRKFVWLP
jgi:anaerobic magnesium-protoporphyrin IX monomethyl ester cyclase